MRKISVLLILLLLALTGCNSPSEAGVYRAYYRPAVGPTVEKKQNREIKPDGQNELKLDVQDGNVSLTSWEGDTLLVKEIKRLKGPGSRKSLEDKLGGYVTEYRNDPYRISISNKPPEKLKPFSRLTTDYEISVPKGIKTLTIKAANGSIGVSGFEGMSIVDLTLETGNIRTEESRAYRFDLTVKRGGITAEKLEGKGSFNITYGDTEIKDVKGEVQLKSTSGRTNVKNVDGRLDCSISKGSLNVSRSFPRAGSSLYASKGDISADFSGIDKEGSYSFMAAAGAIRLGFPDSAGFALTAESVKGKVISDYKPSNAAQDADAGKKLSMTVAGGGPSVNIYVDQGDITLRRMP